MKCLIQKAYQRTNFFNSFPGISRRHSATPKQMLMHVLRVTAVVLMCFIRSHQYAYAEKVLFRVKCFVMTIALYLDLFHLSLFILHNSFLLLVNFFRQRIFYFIYTYVHWSCTRQINRGPRVPLQGSIFILCRFFSLTPYFSKRWNQIPYINDFREVYTNADFSQIFGFGIFYFFCGGGILGFYFDPNYH